MKLSMGRKVSRVLLLVGVALMTLGILGFGTAHTYGGSLSVALLVGFLLVVLGLADRLRGRGR
jgi:hypothetical protein